MKALYFAMFIFLVFSFGCAEEKKPNVTVIPKGDRESRNNQPGQDSSDTGTDFGNTYQMSYGIVHSPGFDQEFNDMVKQLVSASMDPQELGQVSSEYSDVSGVRLTGKLVLPNSFCNDPDYPETSIQNFDSELQILIYDDKVGQFSADTGESIEPVRIAFSGASEGTIKFENGQFVFDVRFQDAYGQVRLNGTIGNSSTTGIVRVQNFTSFDGGAPQPVELRVLGDFAIATNAFIACE